MHSPLIFLSLLVLSCFSLVVSQPFCFLKVPADPLTAAGLATPYLVNGAGCTQTLGAGTFVQGVILNLDTGNFSTYNPLVIVAGTAPAITPVAPILPVNYVAALWFGTNGMTTTLNATVTVGPNGPIDSLVSGNCVNGGGTPYSIFGQFAACNAVEFFAAADSLRAQGLLFVPPLGKDFQGNNCPTTHDFGIVDQDQSDNTDTTYLVVTATGLVAQDTPANRKSLGAGKFTVIDNGSDELLINLVQKAVNCTPWMIPDLADLSGVQQRASLATNELQARQGQRPFAFVPAADPMAMNTVLGAPDINKLNAYRMSVGQTVVTNLAQASLISYCTNMYFIGAPRILTWLPRLLLVPPPDFAVGIGFNLGVVLINRYGMAVGAGNLNCVAALNLPNPFGGFTVSATQFIPPAGMVNAQGVVITPNNAPATQLQIQTVLGVQNLAPDFNGQIGDPFRTPLGYPLPQLPTISGAAGSCYLTVPAQPLTAIGLATPYVVSGNGCVQSLGAGTFVQGVIINIDTGAIFVYNPLVINSGTTPAIPPIVPVLPQNSVVGLWFGTNGMTTTLVPTFTDGVDSLVEGHCVNGGGKPFSIFLQFAACNAQQWFAIAENLIFAKKLQIPNGVGLDINGNPCPTTHDFSVVDQDQSDNTDTKYILTPTGQTAQYTASNAVKLPAFDPNSPLTTSATAPNLVIDNGSDELLITLIQKALGCTPWTFPDLADPLGATNQGFFVPSLPTNELQGRFAQRPIAFIPAGDPMVVNAVTMQPDLDKLNAYRVSVGQVPLLSLAQASTVTYCNNLYAVGAPKIAANFPTFLKTAPPDFAVGLSNTLAGVLVARFNAAVGPGGLNCVALLNKPSPFSTFTFGPPAANGNGGALILPANMFNTDGTLTAAQVNAGMTVAAALGVGNMVADFTGQLGDPQLTVNGTQAAACNTGQAANAGTGANAGGTGTGTGTGTGVVTAAPIVITQTTTDATAFNAQWFGIGIAIGLVVGLIVMFAIIKASASSMQKSRYNTSNLAMANGV